ncbi:uncharacterized protein F5891DRAFT_987199 [Suillus fuscotomentosus]|uniref:Uncharacterized protein n=1 Tax=Suillus fuscotomentosus TaxID=1912939 RepID=A0AAD4DQJ2_9AGAM|nr:uncharacterized protein F5891DRAFT_987199 [Suillus fuscotomentosus]KAG1889767.1 hypothetical protein F5891DRAFT_987199 [Suillus fuscotomentosus]
MIPSEEANAALNDTLTDVQSLIKRCMKLKEGDSATALALSDEIARRLAKDLKLYGGSATSFSPQLLSCAAVIRQYTKGGMFTSSPDWTTVGDNDPRIKDHPRFQKTIHYRAPTGSEKTEHELASLAQTDVPQAVVSFPSLDGPEGSPRADIQTPVKLLPSTEKPQHANSLETVGLGTDHGSAHVNGPARTPEKTVLTPPPTLTKTMEQLIPVPTSTAPARTPETTVLTPSPTFTKALEPLTPLPISIAPAKSPEQSVVTWDPKTREQTHRQHRNDKKRQVEDDVADETDIIHRPAPRPLSRQPKRKKKFMSDEEEEARPHGTIYVARKHHAQQHASSSTASAVATGSNAMSSDVVGDKGFWDVDTRPAGWGRDSTIATAAEYSVRHHPRKCDKCVKLDVPCIVLPDKKYGFTRLACANCDEMKITCAIDGVGVRERLQAKAKSTDTAVHLPAKHTKTRAHKLRAAKSQAKHVPSKKAQPTTRFSRAEKKVVHHLLDDTITERPMDLVKTHPDPPAKPNVPQLEPALAPATANSSTCIRETQVSSSAPGNPPEPEPSARDILHSIHDLGKRFDLLATNERVDAIDERLDSVKERLDVRLTVLEQRLSTSAEQWKATSSTVGNLSMSVRKHINDVAVHRHREHVGGRIASQQDNASHLPWTFRNAGSGNEDIALSQIGRPAHGLTERGNIRRAHYSGRSTSAAQIPGASLSLLSSSLSSRFSSAPPGDIQVTCDIDVPDDGIPNGRPASAVLVINLAFTPLPQPQEPSKPEHYAIGCITA